MKRICIAATLLAALFGTGVTAVGSLGSSPSHPRTVVVADTAWGGGCGPLCKG
ncbi:hypothetical protein ABIA32_005317 [Streptacidiphilus sp. MAP12-20]